ncbi:MAG: hypothetical protein ABI862_10750 [Ilumatobacteraceae bacterium]
MDGRLFRWSDDLADRTTWAHGIFTVYADYGIVLFAVLVLAACLDDRHHDDMRALAGRV